MSPCAAYTNRIFEQSDSQGFSNFSKTYFLHFLVFSLHQSVSLLRFFLDFDELIDKETKRLTEIHRKKDIFYYVIDRQTNRHTLILTYLHALQLADTEKNISQPYLYFINLTKTTNRRQG